MPLFWQLNCWLQSKAMHETRQLELLYTAFPCRVAPRQIVHERLHALF